MRLLRFRLDAHQYGIASDSVVEIVRAVAITPLPGAPSVVEGVIDVRGTIVPVFDLRARFSIPSKALEPSDQFILARTPSRIAALHVDRVEDLVDVDGAAMSDLSPALSGTSHLAGIATLPDGLVLIHDVETFLSRAEADCLATALAGRNATRGAR
ncbi:MAG TPA: chemotaxis protein CheW [Gemmatimonadaceae bacterium]